MLSSPFVLATNRIQFEVRLGTFIKDIGFHALGYGYESSLKPICVMNMDVWVLVMGIIVTGILLNQCM